HQVFPITGIQGISNIAHELLLKNFNELWIPDFEKYPGLAGKLSHGKIKMKHHYIGSLSRFSKQEKPVKYKLACILSGPEPQRNHLQDILLQQLEELDLESVVILGKTNEAYQRRHLGKIEIHNYLLGNDLNAIINESEIVVCRSGYSSLMDLTILKKKIILIPTPGQTEQIHLAKELANQDRAVVFDQSTVNLKEALEMLDHIGPIDNEGKANLFMKTVNTFLGMKTVN
ncbi:MAG: glycosyltransferase, partial [Bacteroidota bacterium]